MEINIKSLIKRAVRFVWIIPLLAILGAAAGYVYVQRNSYTLYYTYTTLISLNTDILITGEGVTADDVAASRRIVQDFLGVANSTRVSTMISRSLEEQGISMSPRVVSALVVPSASTTSNIITLQVSSTDRTLVVPVANTAADCFVSSIYDLFGVNYLSVLDEAETVYSSKSMSQTTMMLYGFAGGFALGLAAVYLLAVLRNKIRAIDDIALSDTEALVVIPVHSIK